MEDLSLRTVGQVRILTLIGEGFGYSVSKLGLPEARIWVRKVAPFRSEEGYKRKIAPPGA